MSTRISFAFIFIILWASIPGYAQNQEHSSDEQAPLFNSEEPLKFTLILDVKTIKKDDSDNPKYSESKLVLHTDHEDETYDIKVRARGISRRNFDFCSFPPIKLNFKKKQVNG